MIKLAKVAEPRCLVDGASAWTSTLLTKLSAGQSVTSWEMTRYRHPDIKQALLLETNGKCAYCESKLRHIHHGDVEHIHPKSKNPQLTYMWTNLTLACEICNQSKRDRDPNAEHIIDPYTTDPEDHIIFAGPLVFSCGTNEGRSTITLLQLDRAELVEMRKDRLSALLQIYERILDGTLPLLTRGALYSDLAQYETAPSAPYAAMARCLIRGMEHKVPVEVRQIAGVSL